MAHRMAGASSPGVSSGVGTVKQPIPQGALAQEQMHVERVVLTKVSFNLLQVDAIRLEKKEIIKAFNILLYEFPLWPHYIGRAAL